MNIVAVAGSLRRNSFNRRLLQAAVTCAPEGLDIGICDLAPLPLFNEDIEPAASGVGAVAELRSLVKNADGVLFSTPEYNQSLPGVLKNAVDWLSRDDSLAGRPVAIIGATAGRWGTRLAQSALRQVLFATESRVMPSPALFLAEAERCFDADGRLADSRHEHQLRELLIAFAGWIRLTGHGKSSH